MKPIENNPIEMVDKAAIECWEQMTNINNKENGTLTGDLL